MKKVSKLVKFDPETIVMINAIIEDRMTFSEFIRFLVDDFIFKEDYSILDEKELSSGLKKISLSLDNKDLEKIKKYSKKNRVSISKEIRKRIKANLNERPIFSTEDKKEIHNLTNQLIKLGTNVNTVAKYFNIKKAVQLNHQQEEFIINQLTNVSSKIDEAKTLLAEIQQKCL